MPIQNHGQKHIQRKFNNVKTEFDFMRDVLNSICNAYNTDEQFEEFITKFPEVFQDLVMSLNSLRNQVEVFMARDEIKPNDFVNGKASFDDDFDDGGVGYSDHDFGSR